ncbi:MAG: STAS/SEC14 domain-containing protein [Boseongicola sp.]|nr:STAS/SEC14 domain-containing protein [Boseongicola sp.]
MFDLEKDPKGFVRLTISGQIDEAEMRSGLDAFLNILSDDGKTDFLYTISDFAMPELSAIAVEFGYIPRLLSSIPKIGRVAVIADAAWLRQAAEIEGLLLPGMTIESFSPGHEADAEAWLMGGEGPDRTAV